MKDFRLKPSVALIATAGLAATCLLPASVMAKATGQCAICHTMHNSQDNAAMAVNGGPNETLLRDSCIGCHTGTNDGSNSIPYVLQTTAPTYGTNTLAGGNFYWVDDDGGATDSQGHNIAEIVATDVAIGEEPPGWNTGFSLNGTVASGGWSGNQLTCAGTLGCHGDHTAPTPFGAINGSHHADDATIDGATVATSYRFLDGITGSEDSDWEYTVSASDHNGYQGDIRTTDTATDGSTISYLCAECHGNFHAGTGDLGVRPDDTMSNPWIRHPTDIQLLTTGEYAAYDPQLAYDPLAPVAWEVPGTQVRAEAVVMCLSCHRAHGSPNDDLLRWDYSTCEAGTDNGACGCFVCHTTKDAS